MLRSLASWCVDKAMDRLSVSRKIATIRLVSSHFRGDLRVV